MIFVTELSKSDFHFSVICLQESWLNESHDLSHFNLDGYTLVSQGKTSSARGGLIIYIYNDFTFKIQDQRNQLDNWKAYIVEIYNETWNKNIIVSNIYRLPRCSNADYDLFFKQWNLLLNKVNTKSSVIFVTGDFNINLLELNTKKKVNVFLMMLLRLASNH